MALKKIISFFFILYPALLFAPQDHTHPGSQISPLTTTIEELADISTLHDHIEEESYQYTAAVSSGKTKGAYVLSVLSVPQIISGIALIGCVDNPMVSYGGGLFFILSGLTCLGTAAARAEVLTMRSIRLGIKKDSLRHHWNNLYTKLRNPS